MYGKTLLSDKLFSLLKRHGCKLVRTGSREICNPPPDGSDEDWLVYTKETSRGFILDLLCSAPYNFQLLDEELTAQYEADDSPEAGMGSIPIKRGLLNLILIDDCETYLRWCRATVYCKARNVMERDERIRIFKAFRTTGEPPCEKAPSPSNAKPATSSARSPSRSLRPKAPSAPTAGPSTPARSPAATRGRATSR